MAWAIGRAVVITQVAWHALGFISGTGLLDCAADPEWSSFRQRLVAATRHRHLVLDQDLIDEAQALVQSLEAEGGILLGAERFYQDMCSHSTQSFCLYGAVNALFVVAAGLQTYTPEDGSAAQTGEAQEYLRIATSLLGLQNCLDFMESTTWPIRSNDILMNLNRSGSEPFTLEVHVDIPWPRPPPVGSSLDGGSSPDLVASLASAVKCSEGVGITAIGTHPTLTLEAVQMLMSFGITSGEHIQVRGTLGITYKCAVFPEMCGGDGAKDAAAGAGDPIAELIGPFDAPPPYEQYTMSRIAEVLEVVGRGILAGHGADILVCTSPYIVCAILQKVTGAPLLAYFGLPLLWKRPTDLFDNATARTEFWGLLEYLHAQPHVVMATNNPLLSEQIAFQAPGPALPVIRPHALFTQATYAPTRLKDAMLISRTKFLWVTLGCAIRHFMPEGYPIAFTVANSDSKLPFRAMASHRAAVLVPWEHALMAFFEFYSMSVPLLMPDASWAYRLVFDAEGNLGSTTRQYEDVSPKCDPALGCSGGVHPHPPFRFDSMASRRYWYQYSSFSQFPHVQIFTSLPDMLQKLLTVDLIQTSAMMKAFNDLTVVRSAAFWRRAARTMLAGHRGCATP